MINCETEPDLSWIKDCVLIKHHNNITGENFTINSSKIYIPVVTFSINYNVKFLENIKQGFKITVSSNKYRSKITNEKTKI